MGATQHHVGVILGSYGAIMVRRKIPILVFTVHHHARKRKVIVFCGMPSDTRTQKKVVAHIG